MCGDVKSTSSTMPVTEVQWIGASCGRHSSYTFYRGFRLIVDGVVKNFCLGEFYFVRNSINQPICIAELQLVWHDASTDSQLASARLYFRPEDTPVGRLANHGQDELLYADQKIVIKCHDMAVWEDTGDQWNCGMVPLCESDFVCVDDKYYLKSNYAILEKETLRNAKEVWMKGDHPRTLQILTFPAYCRYRALIKRLIAGTSLTRAHLVALGGVIAQHRSIRVLFCRESFHHPSLDKFELSGDIKAPVLKGRPRKKKRIAPNSVLKKKRFVQDIQNHLENSPAAKRCKLSEEEESTGSDVSEGVLERVKAPPYVGRKVQSAWPPPLVKPKAQVTIPVKRETTEIPKVAGQDVAMSRVENAKIPPPLISSNKIKVDVVQTSQPLQASRKQVNNANITECSRTTPIQKAIYSTSTKIRDIEKVNNNNNNVSLIKPRPADRVQIKMTPAPQPSPSKSLESKTGKILNSSVKPSNPAAGTTVVYTHNAINPRKVQTIQADACSRAATNSRPVTSTQGTVSTQMATSTSPSVRSQPVASLPQPVTSSQAVAAKPQHTVTPLVGTVSLVNIADGMTASVGLPVRSKPSKENEEKPLRPPCVSEAKKENAEKQTDEAVVWKKKKKRLRMPGNVKDEEYDGDDEKHFMQTLREFMKKTNQPLGKLPALGFKKVNLWTMYSTAQKFGGYDAVTSKRLWRRVYDSLGGSTTITSAATYTRRHYERLLLPYEKYVKNQLKKQMDEKNPPTANSLTHKVPLNKSEKKQGLAVSNTRPGAEKVKPVAVKLNQGVVRAPPPPLPPSRPPQQITTAQSLQASSIRVNTTSVARENVVKTTDSHQVQSTVVSVADKASFNQGMSPATVRSIQPEPVRATKQEPQEPQPKTWSNKPKTGPSLPVTSSMENRNRDVPTEQLPRDADTIQQNRNYIKTIRNDDEASARTNTVYAKNIPVVSSNLKPSAQSVPLQKVTRPVRDDPELMSPPSQLLNPVSKGREIIDLTSDSPPGTVLIKSNSAPRIQGSQGNAQEMSKAQKPVAGGDAEVRRQAQKQQTRQEYHDSSSRHHPVREVQSSGQLSPVYDVQTHRVQSFNHNKVQSQVQDGFSGPTPKKVKEESYAPVKQETVPPRHVPVKQETVLPRHDRKRPQQARVENIEGRYTHSPSQESVDEHFAEWIRRQSSVQHHHPKSSVNHHMPSTNPELGHFRYRYVPEDVCPPDCSCSLSTSRKDEMITAVPPPKLKKEHYEEDLPFPAMWSPPIVPDHPDLYMSHTAHLQAQSDALASHLCTPSRIFIPTPQLFSPPYHMSMGPMGAPLIAGADDQLHIHPHCLMGSPYPCTSSSRTPDGKPYPLYSYT